MRFTNTNTDNFMGGPVARALKMMFEGNHAPFLTEWDLLTGDDRRVAVPMGEGWGEDALHLRFAIPGVSKNQFTLSTQGECLILRGHRDKPEALDLVGLPYGKFERVLELSPDLALEKLRAELHDGVLDVKIPLRESMKTTEVPIHSAQEAVAA